MKPIPRILPVVFMFAAFAGFSGTLVSKAMILRTHDLQRDYEVTVMEPLRQTAAEASMIPVKDGGYVAAMWTTKAGRKFEAARQINEAFSDHRDQLRLWATRFNGIGVGGLLLTIGTFCVHLIDKSEGKRWNQSTPPPRNGPRS